LDTSGVRADDAVISASHLTPTAGRLVDVGAVALQEHVVLVGNRRWIHERNSIPIPDDVERKLLAHEQLGHTAILVAVDGELSHVVT
jgi:cation transport ATPase